MENIEYLKKQISIMLNLFNGKHYSDLIYKGNLLIKKFPDQPILYNLTSLAYSALGKPFEAKELLIKVLKKEPKNFHVLNNLGLVCTELNEYKQAEEYYNKASDLNSNFPDPLVNLGNLKTNQNKNEEAKNLFINTLSSVIPIVNKKMEILDILTLESFLSKHV